KPPLPYESWFELEVALAIAGRGFRVVPQFEMADKRIDLMVEGSSSRLAVECDGDEWHGPERFADDMHRQRKLERMGLTFFRVRDSAFYANRETALAPLWKELSRLGIFSLTRPPDADDLPPAGAPVDQETAVVEDTPESIVAP